MGVKYVDLHQLIPQPQDFTVKSKKVEIDRGIIIRMETTNPLISTVFVYAPIVDFRRWVGTVNRLERMALSTLKKYGKKVSRIYEKVNKRIANEINMREYVERLAKELGADMECNPYRDFCYYYITIKKEVSGVGEVEIMLRSSNFTYWDRGEEVFLKLH